MQAVWARLRERGRDPKPSLLNRLWQAIGHVNRVRLYRIYYFFV